MREQIIEQGAILIDLAIESYDDAPKDIGDFSKRTTTPLDIPSGYFGVAYQDAQGNVYIAHRGTEDIAPDVVPNDLQFGYTVPDQFNDAYTFTKEIALEFGVSMDQITHIGHSLGGGLGNLMSQATGADAWSYNAPRTSQLETALQERVAFLEEESDPSNISIFSGNNITQINAVGDPISNLPGNQIPQLGTVIDIETSDSVWDGILITLFDEQISSGGLLSGNINPFANGGILNQIISDVIEISVLGKFHLSGPLDNALKKEAGIFQPNEFIDALSNVLKNIDDLPEGSYIKMEGGLLSLNWEGEEYQFNFDDILIQIQEDSGDGNKSATTVNELTDTGNTVKVENAETGKSSTFTLTPTSGLEQLAAQNGYTLDQLLALAGNEQLNQQYIPDLSGVGMDLMLTVENQIVYLNPVDIDGEIAYSFLQNGYAYYDPEADNPYHPGMDTSLIDNTYLDFQSNIDENSNNAADTSQNWLLGAALSGGDFVAWMPEIVINGDGFINTQPSAIVTDYWRPGNFELADIDYEQEIKNSLGFLDSGMNYWDRAVQSTFGDLTSLYFEAPTFENIDPLVVDLDGDGVNLVSFNNSHVSFDVDNDGFVENTGWVSGADGIVVHDKNGDGIINDISETISEYYTENVVDGLEALATLDSNNDGIFNNLDDAWTSLRVWQDANEDGVTDDGELKTFDSLDIVSINLSREIIDRENLEGNPVLSRSTMTMDDGSTREVAAVDFTTNPMGYEWNDVLDGAEVRTENNESSSFIITDTTGQTVDAAEKQVNSIYGNIGDDTLIGDDGDNWLVGGKGSDTFIAGAGDDFLIIDADDNTANIDAGEGFDNVRVADNRGVNLNLNDIHAEVAQGGGGNDVLIGGGLSNVFISGGGGDDIIIGGAADDALAGEDGDDLVDGGYGDDIIRGHRGKDVLIGGLGGDYMDGGQDDDILKGGEGNDILIGGEGNDKLDGGAGFDMAEYKGDYDRYVVRRTAEGFEVEDTKDGYIDTLTGIERIRFGNVDFNIAEADSVPMPVKDNITISGYDPITITAAEILGNDWDLDNDSLSIDGVSDAVGGTVELLENGDVLFTPDEYFLGNMSFDYTVKDAGGNIAHVYLKGDPDNAVPLKAQVNLYQDTDPADPLFYNQWYFSEIRIKTAWQDYSGAGINIGLFEGEEANPFNYLHTDLNGNVSAEFVNNISDVEIDSFSNHATLVAGVIGAERNDEGGVGIAYNATLSDHSWNPDSYGLMNMINYDIANNSWGSTELFNDNFNNTLDNEYWKGVELSIDNAAYYGRNGLGTAIVQAGGNSRADGDSVNYHNMMNSRLNITTGSINQEGDLSKLITASTPFSNPGAAILVSAPGSNIQSTSNLLENENGSTFGDDFSVTQGTSFSAPIISGVVALMLEANPLLGSRDIQKILAYSARNIDDDNTDWQYNGATTKNGGGLHFSNDYGFGIVDVHTAVRLAETWNQTNTFNNEITSSVANNNSQNLTDNGTVTSNVSVTSDINIEYVEVKVDIDHSRIGDLVITLISPDGTQSVLLDRPGKTPGSDDADTGLADEGGLKFTLSSANFYGETGIGQWQLQITDAVTGETGILNNWELKLYGSDNNGNDVYVFTDELGAYDEGNHTIIDGFGIDSINASGLLTDSVIDLNIGATSIINGKEVTLATDTFTDEYYQKQDALPLKQAELTDTQTELAAKQQELVDKQALLPVKGEELQQANQMQPSVTVAQINAKYAEYQDFLTEWNHYTFQALYLGSYVYYDNVIQKIVVFSVAQHQAHQALPAQINATTDEYNTLIEQRNSEITSINQLRESLYNEIQSLQGDIQNLPSEITSLESQVAGLTNEITSIQNYLNSFGNGDTIIENAYGGDGDDTIIGNAADNILYDGRGNDTLTGNAGADIFQIKQHAGDIDLITDFEILNPLEKIDITDFKINSFADLVLTQDGDDTVITFIDGQQLVLNNVTVSELNENNFAGFISQAVIYNGSDNNDNLYGDSRNDTINAGNGDDYISGGNGNNELTGGSGSDKFFISINAGKADTITDFDINDYNEKIVLTGFSSIKSLNDLSISMSGNDTVVDLGDGQQLILKNVNPDDLSNDNFIFHGEILGSKDADTLYGTRLEDIISAGSGNDEVYAGENDDYISGGDGDDKLFGQHGNDTIIGGAGNDKLSGGIGNDYLSGGDGEDVIAGQEGDDLLKGGTGDDVLFGQEGNDILSGGEGDDFLFGASGINTLSGGAGNDSFVIENNPDSITVITDLELGNTLEKIDFTLYEGLTSFSQLNIVQKGSDAVINLPDNQQVVVKNVNVSSLGSSNFRFPGDEEITQINGTSGVDVINGYDGRDVIYGNAGDDWLHGGDNDDIIYGGTGDDTIYGDGVRGEVSLDVILTDVQIGNDRLYGGDGNDVLLGYRGNDYLVGGLGDDILSGGEGSDTFVITREFPYRLPGDPAGSPNDVILDFDVNDPNEKIDISDIVLNTSVSSFSDLQITQGETGAIIAFPQPTLQHLSQIIILQGVNASDINASHFIGFNPTPVLGDDIANTNEDSSVSINIMENDATVEGGSVNTSLINVQQPAHGSVVFNTDTGIATYTPSQGFYGQDSFTYTAKNSSGVVLSTATVTITVKENSVPAIDSVTVSTQEDNNVTITLPEIIDYDGGIIVPTQENIVISNITGGAVVAINADGTINYQPPADFFGTDRFTYSVRDANGELSEPARVTINVSAVNDIPVVTSVQAIGNEDSIIKIAVPLVADVEDGSILLTSGNVVFSNLTNGATVSVNSDGTFNYKAPENFFGDDSFTYGVRDGNGALSEPATVNVTVSPVNDAPSLQEIAASGNEDNAITIAIPEITDAEEGVISPTADNITFTDVTAGTTVSLNADGTINYQPPANFFGADSFKYYVTDSSGEASLPATVTINVAAVNDEPVATITSITNYSDEFVVDVLSGASDIDGDNLTITNVTTPSNGTATIVDGHIVYTSAAPNGAGDSFEYTISDGNGGSVTKTLTISAPEATEDNAAVIDVVAGMAWYAANTYSIQSVTNGANGTAEIIDGKISYTPDLNFNGTETLQYSLIDQNNNVINKTLTFAVSPVNDAPEMVKFIELSKAYFQNQTIAFSLGDSFADVDGDAISYDVTLADGSPLPTWLNFDSQAGDISGTAPANAENISIKVTVTDTSDASTSANFNLIVLSEDRINGTIGDDDISGTDNADVIFGDDGNDTISSSNGDDIILGGAGDDVITGDNGNNIIFGGEGNDEIRSGWGIGNYNELYGGNGNDILVGGYGTDILYGGDGNDILNSGRFNNVLIGGTGSDQFVIQFGSNSSNVIKDFDVNDSNEKIDFSKFNSWGITDISQISIEQVGLNAVIHMGRYDQSVVVENVNIEDLTVDKFIGLTDNGNSSEDLVVNGSVSDDILQGGLGNDEINGYKGDDLLNGGAGNDVLTGGEGFDTFIIEKNPNSIDVINDFTGFDTVELNGFAENITITDFSYEENDGNLTLDLGDGQSLIINGFTYDKLVWALNLSDSGTNGTNNNDRIVTSGYNVNAGAGDDLIWAKSGYNYINGGSGNDTIIGTGRSYYANIYAIEKNAGDIDTIVNVGTYDSIRLDGFSSNNLQDFTKTQDGSNVVVDLGDGQQLIFKDASIEEVEALYGYREKNVIYSAQGILLNGSDENELVIAGSADDNGLIINAGGGDDYIRGSYDTDIFVIEKSSGDADLISNFDTSQDAIDLRGFNFSQLSDLQFTEERGENGVYITIIDLGDNQTLTLRGVDAEDLALGHFIGIDPVLNGTSGNDILYANDAYDHIIGDDGNDIIYGSEYSNRLEGGNGDDILQSSDEDTVINRGLDTLVGGAGNDRFVITSWSVIEDFEVSNSNEKIDLSFYRDLLSYDDLILSEFDGDTYVSFGSVINPNQLLIIKNVLPEQLSADNFIFNNFEGTSGDDVLVGDNSNNVINGGEGNDIIDGGRYGTDTLTGGSGSDTFVINYDFYEDIITDFDVNDPNEKIDLSKVLAVPHSNLKDFSGLNIIQNGLNTIVEYDGSSYSFILENVNASDIKGSHFIGITDTASSTDDQILVGEDYEEDNLLGGFGNDVLDGKGYDDTLNGGAGNDTLLFGDGDDVLTGGAGSDIFKLDRDSTDYYYSNASYTITDFDVNDPNEKIDLSILDNVRIRKFEEIRFVADGNDTLIYLYPQTNQHIRVLNTSPDQFTQDNVIGITDELVLREGTDGDDSLYASASDNYQLDGKAGNDYLFGNDGYDILNGGDGDDILNGGKGQDILSGGAGDDTFIFNKISYNNNFGHDVITDFEAGNSKEKIKLPEIRGVYSFTDLNITQDGANAIITIDANNSITLENINKDQLIQENFSITTSILATNSDDVLIDKGDTANTKKPKYVLHENFPDISGSSTYTAVSYGASHKTGFIGLDRFESIDDTTYYVFSSFNPSSDFYQILDLGISSFEELVMNQVGNDTVISLPNGDRYIKLENVVLEDITADNFMFTALNSDWNNNVIYVYDGNDYVEGGAGDDKIYGGAGNDVLYGGVGDDYLSGGAGNDILYGGAGNDIIDLGAGANEVHGGEGDDDITDETVSDNNIVYGDGGDDTININGNNNVILGGMGDDYIASSGNNVSIDGGAGNDVIYSDIGNTNISGGEGDDSIASVYGNSTISGDDGNDTISVGEYWLPYVVNVPELTGSTVYGGAGNDRIFVSYEDNNIIYGGEGRDYVKIYGEAGYESNSNVIYGGSEGDIFAFGSMENSVNTIADFDVHDPNEKIDVQFMNGMTSFAEFFAELNITQNDADTVINLSDNQSVILRNVAVTDLTVHHFIFPMQGSDNDGWLIGTENDDVIIGGSGNEIIYGRGGDDSLVGGEGSDTFVFNASDSSSPHASIVDFDVTGDVINLSGFSDVTGFEDLAISYWEGSAYVYNDDWLSTERVSFSLDNIAENSLTAANFLFERLNTPPVVVNDITTQAGMVTEEFNFTIPANTFREYDGDELTYTAFLESGEPLPAWLIFDAATGTFSGTPEIHDDGTLSIAITANDGRNSTTTLFSVEIAGKLSVTGDQQAVSYTEDTDYAFGAMEVIASSASVSVTIVLSDANAGILSATADTGGVSVNFSNGVWSATGAIDNINILLSNMVFTPAENYNADFTIGINVDDGVRTYSSNDISLTGIAVNDAPVINIELTDASANEDTVSIVVGAAVVQSAFVDIETAELTYSMTVNGSNAPSWLSIDNVTGEIISTNPSNGDVGSYTIALIATDSEGLTATQGFTLNILNTGDAPTEITLDNMSIDENAIGAVVGNLSVADIDAGDTYEFVVSDDRFEVAGGQLKLKDGISLNYEEINPDYRIALGLPGHPVSVTVTATDSYGLSTEETFDIMVNNVNEAPTDIILWNNDEITGDIVTYDNEINIDENIAIGTTIARFAVIDDFTDSGYSYELDDDAGGLFEIVETPDSYELKIKNAIDFESSAVHSIVIRVVDSGSHIFTKDFSITVNNVNESPSANNDTAGVTENGSIDIDVLANDSDVDGDSLTVDSLDTTGTIGNVSVNPDGTVKYDTKGQFDYLKNGETATDTFDYTVSDGNGGFATETVTVTINGSNDAPVINLGSGIKHAISSDVHMSLLDQNLQDIPVIESPDGQTVYPDAISSHRMTMTEDGEATVAFKNSVAGYKNSLGWYTIDKDGTIRSPQLFFSNAKTIAGGTQFSLGTLAAGTEIGFFVIANGGNGWWQGSDGSSISSSQIDFSQGTLRFEDENGNEANAYGDSAAKIVYEKDGVEYSIDKHVFHSNSNSALNADGQIHGGAGWDSATGDLLVGLEDLYGGGDRDYNDILFHVDMGNTSESLKYVNAPSLGDISLTDIDSSQMAGANVEIASGYVEGDQLVFEGYQLDESGNITGTGLAVVTTVAGGILTLSITGDADAATYESVLNAIRLVNDGSESDVSGIREISISVTGGEGAETTAETAINITSDPITGIDNADNLTGTALNDAIYGRSGDDVIDSGDGSDVIHGGAGADTIFTGLGEDSIDFSFLTDSTSTNRDVIADFEQGSDILNFEELAQYGIINFDDITVTNDGSNTFVAANDSDFEVELVGVYHLTDSDFHWG